MNELDRDLKAMNCLVHKMTVEWARPDFDANNPRHTRWERAVQRLFDKMLDRYVYTGGCVHETIIGLRPPHSGSICQDCGLIISPISYVPRSLLEAEQEKRRHCRSCQLDTCMDCEHD